MTESRYHHGDLPVTLMDLALEHIAAEGTEKLSLRALAREAGVSPTAPYRHFPTKRCLLAALATRGFRRLQVINATHDLENEDLETAFMRLGMGYIRFALENPTAYGIMFGTVIEDFSSYPDLAEAAEASYAPVRRLVDRMLAHYPDEDMTADLLAGATWSSVHGIASLLIFGQSRTDRYGDRGPSRAMRALAADPEAALRAHMLGLLKR
ncbi:MAG: TetR/AcrR family transcriptional regulator [Pseudomonadales bacterium]